MIVSFMLNGEKNHFFTIFPQQFCNITSTSSGYVSSIVFVFNSEMEFFFILLFFFISTPHKDKTIIIISHHYHNRK